MFTGLVEKTATVLTVDFGQQVGSLILQRPQEFATNQGDSVSVNGCCLTVANFHDSHLAFDVNGETAEKTNLCCLVPGDVVNLERAMTLGSRLDGHLVTGHVDLKAELLALEKRESGWVFTIQIPASQGKLIVPKGSICLDGVSLTLNQVTDDEKSCRFKVMLIPTTLNKTHFASIQPGWVFNIEFDIIAKYLEKLARFSSDSSVQ